MKATALLLELLDNGGQLWVEGDELCFRVAKGILTPALREELSRHKEEIIVLLGQRARYALSSFAHQQMWLVDQDGARHPNLQHFQGRAVHQPT
jgi:hypothetical protein